MPQAALRARMVPFEGAGKFALLGSEFTTARPDSGVGGLTFYRVRSYPAGDELPSSEILVPVPDARVQEVAERLRSPGR